MGPAANLTFIVFMLNKYICKTDFIYFNLMKRFPSKTNFCIYFDKFSLVTSYFDLHSSIGSCRFVEGDVDVEPRELSDGRDHRGRARQP